MQGKVKHMTSRCSQDLKFTHNGWNEKCIQHFRRWVIWIHQPIACLVGRHVFLYYKTILGYSGILTIVFYCWLLFFFTVRECSECKWLWWLGGLKYLSSAIKPCFCGYLRSLCGIQEPVKTNNVNTSLKSHKSSRQKEIHHHTEFHLKRESFRRH